MGMAYSDEQIREMRQREADSKGMYFMQKYIDLKTDLRKLEERMRKRGDLVTEVWADEVRFLIDSE